LSITLLAELRHCRRQVLEAASDRSTPFVHTCFDLVTGVATLISYVSK
jgi:hypothetical protein